MRRSDFDATSEDKKNEPGQRFHSKPLKTHPKKFARLGFFVIPGAPKSGKRFLIPFRPSCLWRSGHEVPTSRSDPTEASGTPALLAVHFESFVADIHDTGIVNLHTLSNRREWPTWSQGVPQRFIG